MPVDIRHIPDAKRRNGCDPCRQAVQTIHQVHCIGDRHQPEHGDPKAEHIAKSHVSRPEIVGDKFDPKSHRIDDDRAYDLPGKLDDRLEIFQVIYQTQYIDQRTSHHGGGHAFIFCCKSRKGYHHTGKNSDSAESWNRLVMHTSVIFRNIHCPDLRRDPDGKGRCDACHGKGQQKRRP